MVWLKRLVAVVLVAVAGTSFWAYRLVTGSLPLLDGEIRVSGLSAPAVIERDALGVVSIRGESRLDVSRALGFVHAQERFFQMDLLRRRAAGELSALLGESTLRIDRRHRVHRMRARAARVVSSASDAELALLAAYTEGVNEGLEALDAPPFEYVLLRQDPAPWTPEDSVLVTLSMFFQLNDETGSREAATGLLYDVLPEALADFLAPRGTDWDAPVVGEPSGGPPIPGPDVIDLRGRVAELAPVDRFREEVELGSNNWAVAGERTEHGGALLASDMHLGHSVPNIWFRTLLSWGNERVVGVTLPGTPSVVAGSNTYLAWGFTNSNGDWVDLVELELHPEDPSRYRTPEGFEKFELYRETIEVKDGDPEAIEVRETVWGPVLGEDHDRTLRAVRWIAHEADAVNLVLTEMETARSVEQGLAIAQRGGIPPQNFVAADRSGAIGWTIAGRIPRRFGFDGRRPSSWADGSRGWDGWLATQEYPVIPEPPENVIWTANARVVGGEMLEKVGDGGYAFGARARQIRDDLLELDEANESDMLEIQLDDRALFIGDWRELFLDALRGAEDLAELRNEIEKGWTGRASTDSTSYRIVRELRLAVFHETFRALTEACREAEPDFEVWDLRQWDGPLWKLVTERPPHLVPPPYENWEVALVDIVRRTASTWEGPLSSRTWGAANRSAIRHPLSRAVPFLSRWLDVSPRALPGDSNMPRVQSPSHGASERMVVSPGREEHGFFHMPGGQSGHPLSPFYRAGHEDWEEGRPTPLLPGEPVYSLTIR